MEYGKGNEAACVPGALARIDSDESTTNLGDCPYASGEDDVRCCPLLRDVWGPVPAWGRGASQVECIGTSGVPSHALQVRRHIDKDHCCRGGPAFAPLIRNTVVHCGEDLC